MKLYLHFSSQLFTNTYLIGNEITKEALIIDPTKITDKMINQIERNDFDLKAVLLTHNHQNADETGLNTILKIYSPNVYAGNNFSEDVKVNILRGDGEIKISGFSMKYFAMPAYSSMFQIENIIFTGCILSSGMVGKCTSMYAANTLQSILKTKLFAMTDDIIIMPFYGPPTSIGVERKFSVSFFK